MSGVRLTQVSIHASVKDATQKQQVVPNNLTVSIHASVKDATFRAEVLDSV